MTYFGTYLTANLLDTATSVREGTPINTVTSGTQKFLATSAANMGLGLVKDRSFARMFGSGSPRPVPLPSFILFAARDAMTVGFSFNVPSRIATYMPANMMLKPESWAQFLAPAACQIISTPLHLIGLDLYNRQGARITVKERLRSVARNYFQSTAARMCRIIPAFGFGGVTNTNVRLSLLDRIEQTA